MWQAHHGTIKRRLFMGDRTGRTTASEGIKDKIARVGCDCTPFLIVVLAWCIKVKIHFCTNSFVPSVAVPTSSHQVFTRYLLD